MMEDGEDPFSNNSVLLGEIMIDSLEEEVEDVEGMIENQEEEIEGVLTGGTGDKDGKLEDLDLIDREDHSVNQETLDNLVTLDRGDHLEIDNLEHLE
jgi:hypothetical protein